MKISIAMKKRFTYFGIGAMVLITMLFVSSCNKDLKFDIKDLQVNDHVDSTTISAKITGEYVFPSVLKGIDVYVSDQENLDDAKVYPAEINDHRFSVDIDGLLGGRKYFYCYEFDNGMEKLKSEVRNFRTRDYSVPVLETFAVLDNDITSTTAKVGGKVVEDFGLEIIAQGVCWSFDSDFTLGNSIGHTEEDLSSNTFSRVITDLEPERTYYVKAYATSSKGTGYGDSKKFTTMDADLAAHITWPLEVVVEVHSIEIAGSVSNHGGDQVVHKGMCWNLQGMPTVLDDKTDHGGGAGGFVSTLTNLYADTTYYIRAYATNSLGQSYYSNEITLRTKSGKAKVTTIAPDNIGTESARGKGRVDDDGGLAVTRRGICWSTGVQPHIGGHYQDDTHGGLGDFLCNIEGLRKDQKYYVRAFAVNIENQVFYGDTISFRTKSGIPDIVVNGVQAAVTDALCYYSVYSGNGLEVLHHGLCWSSSTSHPTLYNNEGSHEVGSGTSSSAFSYTITGLTPEKHYYVCAYATNAENTYYSEPSYGFDTYSGQASITSFKVTKIKSSSALCEAYVSTVGGYPNPIDDRGVCWGTQHDPTYSANNPNQYSAGAGAGSIYSSIQGLSSETVYYARVYVRYNGTVQYSEEIQFKTTKEGGLPGEFSVGQNKKVCFSQSNLKYKDQHWSFAENQWEVYGNNGQGSTSTTANRDLFGWGTSGYNHNSSMNGCYQPWSTSSDDNRYYAYGHPDWNLYDGSGNADWGYNSISHGGNQENSGWRTMKKSEWGYLLVNRPDAQLKLSQGTVVDVHGLILLPDEWELPSGLTFVPKAANWTTNTYTEAQWREMEAKGAVFLPAAGCRAGTSVDKVGTHGYYWSSSLYDATNTYVMTFNAAEYESQHTSGRSVGRSVRLVKDL